MRQALWARLTMIALIPFPVADAASPPSVRFSTSHAVACRDVTPPEFAALYPEEKLIEAQFRVDVVNFFAPVIYVHDSKLRA